LARNFFLSAAALFLLASASCGIEVYYSLEPPSSRAFTTGLTTETREFSFYTNEATQLSVFQGTDVYYKIYNNLSDLTSESTTISSSNAEYSSNGYNRMVSLGFKQLDTTSHPNILFPQTGTAQTVFIRLIDEGPKSSGGYNFPAGITPTTVLPLRRSNGKGFNFYIDPDPDNCDDRPASGDSDTRFSSSPETDTWYVSAYAVSVGQDTYLTPLYSQLLWLGYIQIKKS
jgi:hypothetical protein